MRKMLLLTVLILFAVVAGILIIRNGQSESEEQTTKIGVLLTGESTDRSYCQAHVEGLESLRDRLPVEMVYREHTPADCYDQIVRLIKDEDCRIIIGVSIDYREAMEKAAEEFPEVFFLHTGGVSYRQNFSSYFGRMYQIRYLSGIVAGLQTKTGELGYVGAYPVPEVIRGLNAFTRGARSVRPDAVVHVKYCNSWTEDDPAGQACRDLLDRHPIDVISVHTNSLQPHAEADARGVWSIGYNRDNSRLFPDTYLTACIWKWDVYYLRQLRDLLQGKFRGSQDWLGMETGMVAISDFSGHIDVRSMAAVQAANERLRSREFDVFYGPVIDNKGAVRVEEGESMSDDSMLKGFYWYVEGVKVEGE